MNTKNEWVPHTQVNFSDETIMAYHVDTRDFHVIAHRESPKDGPDLTTIKKYPDRFFFTGDEVRDMICRYHIESGGDLKWRFFMVGKIGDWQMKYIRIYRTPMGLVVCNSSSKAFNREQLSQKGRKTEWD